MRLVRLDNVSPGAKLGEPVFGANGQVLLFAGVSLTSDYIETLRKIGTHTLYVLDADTADIPSPAAISPEVRAKAMTNLSKAFESVSKASDGLRQASMSLAQEHIKSKRFAEAAKAVADGGDMYGVCRDVNSILDQLGGQDVLVGLNSIKSHDSYTFQHSIDVTIMGLMLAKKLGWDKSRMSAFGVGCILHDVGKIFIPPEVLNKNGKLTEEEYQQVKAHPSMGYEVIKAIAPNLGFLAPHVAYQHHEKHDGSGYPRGLRGPDALSGGNNQGRIHEFGVIAAVADVYDAMSSDRPYRAGWEPDRVVRMIMEGVGSHFHHRAAALLAEAVAPYPVYANIKVRNGRYAAHQGLVSAVNKKALDRPTVRLLYDATGQRIDPVEIDLRVDKDVSIECVRPPESRHGTGAAAA